MSSINDLIINAIDLTKLRNSEYIAFSKDFASMVNTNNPTTLKVGPQYTAMQAKNTELENLFKLATGNPMTAEMEILDQRRDRSFMGITAVIGGYRDHFDAAMSGAANVLQQNLNIYGASYVVTRDNYQSETVTINNLVNDWQTKPELQNAVDMLGLLDWVLELKTVNDSFGQKYLERTHEFGAASPENLKSKRLEAMTTYYALRNRLNALVEIEGIEAYQTVVNDVNALINQYNALLTGRTTAPATEEVSPN